MKISTVQMSLQKDFKVYGNTTKNVEKTNDQIKKTLSTLEGCEAIIQAANKEIQKLDKNSKTYNEDLKKIKNTIMTAQVAKLSLIDRSTMSGLAEAKGIVQKIINELPQGSAELTNWQTVMSDIDKKMFEFYEDAAANGGLKQMKEASSAIRRYIDELPQGSDELETWVKRWQEINAQVDKATRDIDNMFKGIEKDSIADLQQQLSDIEKELQNKNLSIDVRFAKNAAADYLKERIARLTSGEPTIKIPVQTYFEKGSFEDMRRSYQNAQTLINRALEDMNNGLINRKQQMGNKKHQ